MRQWGQGKPLGFNPNGTVGFLGIYGWVLTVPVQLFLWKHAARRWSGPGEDHIRLSLFCLRFRWWPPLVSLRPRGVLTGNLEWNDLAVHQEPRSSRVITRSRWKGFRQAPARIRARRVVQPLTRNLPLIGFLCGGCTLLFSSLTIIYKRIGSFCCFILFFGPKLLGLGLGLWCLRHKCTAANLLLSTYCYHTICTIYLVCKYNF